MPDTPHDVHLPLAEFDRHELPEAERDLQGEEFRRAVEQYFIKQLSGQSGAAEVVVTDERIIIRWIDAEAGVTLVDQGVGLIKQGEAGKGISFLQKALERNPEDASALFNLGMALGDRNEGQDAQEGLKLLLRLVAKHPTFKGGWVALGVAQARAGDWENSIVSLREAIRHDPNDGHARKNLGAALSRLGQHQEGKEHLMLASMLLPQDPQVWLNLAMNLEESGSGKESAVFYRKVISLDPGGRISEVAETGLNRITSDTFREKGGTLRQEAVDHCLEALRIFKDMTGPKLQKITFEIAMLGAKGLNVSDPAERHTLTSLPGTFSGLKLLCLEYVGFKIIDPSVDLGFDITAEYEEALRVHRGA